MEYRNIPENKNKPVTNYAKKVKSTARKKHSRNSDKWEGKPMHDQYPERVGKPDINQENTRQWLKSGLKAETEGFIIAAQDQSLPTKLYQHSIIKNGSDPKCRMCHNCDESVDHIVSGCPVLAKDEYLHNHDKAAAYMHWNICKHYNLPATEKWYEHKPNTVTENDECTIL